VAERKTECRVELLLGRRVRTQDGRVVGRIEEMRAEIENSYYVVTEFHLGPHALIESLAVRHFGLTLPGRVHGYRVRWDQLDLTDQEHPRLTCPIEELERLGAPRRHHRKKNAA
jgi:sporulation protein YlmC with PRC-barrel domain